jgi:hypothetical protein
VVCDLKILYAFFGPQKSFAACQHNSPRYGRYAIRAISASNSI